MTETHHDGTKNNTKSNKDQYIAQKNYKYGGWKI